MDSVSLTGLAAYLGAGIAIGLGAIGAAIGEGYTASQANAAVSRNPKLSGDIFKTMLVGQAIAESASIFALVVHWFSFLPRSMRHLHLPPALFSARHWPWALAPSVRGWGRDSPLVPRVKGSNDNLR